MSRWVAGLLLLLAWVAPGSARAQLQFAGDAPRVYTVEPREHLYRHELTLGIGVLPLDAFYVGTPAMVSYTYNFNPLWSWEAINAFYSFDVDTSLTGNLKNQGIAPSDDASVRIRMMVSTNAVVKPMFGKIAVFNRGVVQAQTGFTVGGGAMVSNVDTRAALNFGAVINFWVSRAVGIRFDVRNYLVFHNFVPSNVLLLALSGSFNFSVRLAEPEMPAR